MNLKTVRVDDRIVTVETLAELEDSSIVSKMKEKFEIAKTDGIIVKGVWEDSEWTLVDECKKCRMNFKMPAYSIQGITYKDYELALKCTVMENVYQIKLATIQATIKYVKRIMIATNGLAKLSAVSIRDAVDVHMPSAVVTFLRRAGVEMALIDDVLSGLVIPAEAQRRYMAEFSSYFLFEDILYAAWEKMDEEKQEEYAPLYLYWKIANIIPQRVTEFALMPYDCLSEQDGTDMVKLRRSCRKSSGRKMGHKIDRDYVTTDFPLPTEIADLIRWYQDRTKGKERNHDCLFIFLTDTGKKSSNNGASTFRHLLDRFYEEYFVDYTVITKETYRKRFWTPEIAEEDSLFPGETVKIDLADVRVICMVNIVQNGFNPTLIRRLTGHETVAMDNWYSGNLCSYLKSRALRQLKNERIEIVDGELSETRKQYLFAGQNGVKVDAGTCFSGRFAQGNLQDCMHANLECKCCRYCIRDITNDTICRDEREVGQKSAAIENNLKRFEWLLNIEDSAGNKASIGTLARKLQAQMENLKDYYKTLLQKEEDMQNGKTKKN